jgi:hypothetical protein
MRTGDTVKHIPSGETWTVAWADERELIPCGWPEGFANVSDCQLIEACSDEEYWKLLNEIAGPEKVNQWNYDSAGPRRRRCFRLLEQRRETECFEMMHV